MSMPAKHQSLTELEPGANFVRRHIGPSEEETGEMLNALGAKSLEDFIAKVVPDSIRTRRPLDLPAPKAERTALSYLRKMADRKGLATIAPTARHGLAPARAER